MTRIPLVDPKDAPEENRKILEAFPVKLNIFRLMAVAENHFKPLLQLGTSILAKQELDPKLRELVILQAAALTPGEYEWVQHVPIAKGVGATDGEIEAVERGDLDADAIGERERVLLRFGEQAMRTTKVDADLFEEARKHFSPREIVEVLVTLGYYSMLARITEVVELDLDEPAGMEVVDSAAGGERR
jgi:alkylhydroperoxidase family enzyme